ncbi:MAG TPA: hypothetical protein VMV69_10715 [Pirellulales bacterium]|nr:hypothetical protein [Pirellulales bacterium]
MRANRPMVERHGPVTARIARHAFWLLAAMAGICLLNASTARGAEATARASRGRGVIRGSIFGVPDDQRVWTPLPLRTLFSEGWDEPWISPPSGDSGAVRQGWVDSAVDGLFYRNFVWLFSRTDGLPQGRDSGLGLFQFQSPLSRRAWISLDVPFVTALYGDSGPYQAASFGDFNVTTRIMLRETRNLSVVASFGARSPTGVPQTGNGLALLFPNMEFWSDLGGGVALRGGMGVEVPTNRFGSQRATMVTNLALGRTVTAHDSWPLGDFQYYLAATVRDNLEGSPGSLPGTYASLTPGFRTHLGREYYLAGGYELPVTGSQVLSQRLTIFFVKGF